MGKIFTTQDSLRVLLKYTANISADINTALIKYEKPDGVEGFWVGTHTPMNKTVHYDLSNAEYLNQAGEWKFWIYATMVDGRVIPGEVHIEEIFEEGAVD